MEDQTLATRKLGELVWAAGGFKGMFNRFWPSTNDNITEKGFEAPTPEWWAEMKEAQKKVDENIQKARKKKK